MRILRQIHPRFGLTIWLQELDYWVFELPERLTKVRNFDVPLTGLEMLGYNTSISYSKIETLSQP